MSVTDSASAQRFPRTRGDRSPAASLARSKARRLCGVTAGRSIPACAGEPSRRMPTLVAGGFYPRVCGGTPAALYQAAGCAVLSPRVRGNLRRNLLRPVFYSSIPACAGEPRSWRRRAISPTFYPRVCGGTPALGRASGRPRVLSPRVRGNLSGAVRGYLRLGSIPACAGEPSSPPRRTTAATFYPRVCGGTLPVGC